jgi:hypothetical protein
MESKGTESELSNRTTSEAGERMRRALFFFWGRPYALRRRNTVPYPGPMGRGGETSSARRRVDAECRPEALDGLTGDLPQNSSLGRVSRIGNHGRIGRRRQSE